MCQTLNYLPETPTQFLTHITFVWNMDSYIAAEVLYKTTCWQTHVYDSYDAADAFAGSARSIEKI